MADYTDSLGFNKGVAAFPNNVTDISKFEVVLDFAAIKAARAAAGVSALAVSDTLEVIPVPAGSVLLTAGMNVLSAETINATAALDVGTPNGPASSDTFVADAALSALGVYGENLSNPTFFPNAEPIAIKIETAVPEDAVVKIFAFIANAN